MSRQTVVKIHPIRRSKLGLELFHELCVIYPEGGRINEYTDEVQFALDAPRTTVEYHVSSSGWQRRGLRRGARPFASPSRVSSFLTKSVSTARRIFLPADTCCPARKLTAKISGGPQRAYCGSMQRR